MADKADLNQIDLVFVPDTTGSMGSFIASAQRYMVSVLKAVGSSVTLRVAIIEFKDHNKSAFAIRVHEFTEKLDTVQQTINRLTADGGGDTPECVLDALYATAHLPWREHAIRQAILIGDAPPHGTYPNWMCQCGKLTFDQTVAALEEANVILHAVAVNDGEVVRPFDLLSRFTGGNLYRIGNGLSENGQNAADPIQAIKSVLERTVSEIAQDGRVLDAWESLAAQNGQPPALDDLRQLVDFPRAQVSASLSRLGQRGFILSPLQPVSF